MLTEKHLNLLRLQAARIPNVRLNTLPPILPAPILVLC
jgi:hypothetical protein